LLTFLDIPGTSALTLTIIPAAAVFLFHVESTVQDTLKLLISSYASAAAFDVTAESLKVEQQADVCGLAARAI